MKRKNVLILLLFVCLNTIYSAGKKGGDEWVLKVNDKVIYQEQFEEGLFIRLKTYSNNTNSSEIIDMINSESIMASYADALINEIILLKDADENKYFFSKDEKYFLKSILRTSKASFFYERYAEDALKNGIDITDSDIEKAFEENAHIKSYYNIDELRDIDRNLISDYLTSLKTIEMFNDKIQKLKENIKIKADIDVLDDPEVYKGSTVILRVNKQKLTLNEFNIELKYAISLQNPMNYNEDLETNYELRVSYFDSILSQMVLVDEGNRLKFFDSEDAKYYLDSYISFTKYQKYANYLMNKFYSDMKNIDSETVRQYFDNNMEAFSNMGVFELNDASEKIISNYLRYAEAEKMFLYYLQDLKDKSSIERNLNILMPSSTLDE